MLRRSMNGTAGLASAALACTLVLAACGAGDDRSGDGADGGSTVGLTDTSIKLGAHYPLTGVAAPGYSEIPLGHQAYYDFVNAAGGVNGRSIEYLVKDDAYDPTKTSSVTNKLVLDDQIFGMVSGLGTPTHTAVVDFLNSEKVPDLFVSSGSLTWGDDPAKYPYTFGWQTDYESEGKIIGQWVKENMPNAKVGLFLQDDDFGEDGEVGVRQFLDDQIVEVVKYTSGNTDVGPQLAALQGAGVDLVVGFNVPSYTALTQLTAMKLNFKPTWFYSNVGADPGLVGALLAKFSEGAVKDGPSLLDGVLSTEYIPGIDAGADNPWLALWKRVWEEHGDGSKLTNFKIYGMSQAYTVVQTLLAAGEDLTRERVVEVLEESGSSFAGPGLAAFRYSEDSHLGISGMRVVKLKGGVGQAQTPVLVTDIGDAPIEEESSGHGDDAPPESGIPEVEPAS